MILLLPGSMFSIEFSSVELINSSSWIGFTSRQILWRNENKGIGIELVSCNGFLAADIEYKDS